MSWSAADIPLLGGKVAVVTGANSGLGYESARALAAARASVVLAARTLEKADDAACRISDEQPDARLETVAADMASLDSVRAAAAEITSAHRSVHILLNNAGVMATPEGRTDDGIETQFGVNHIGHWVLTARLMPALVAADAARVVTVTSAVRYIGRPVNPDNPNLEGSYSAWAAYGQAKLANYHFAIGLQREFEQRGLSLLSLMAHPGLSKTNLQVTSNRLGGAGRAGHFWGKMAAWVGMDPKSGALPQLRAATDPGAAGGQFYAPRYLYAGVPVRRPVLRPRATAAVRLLWQVSERLTGEALFDHLASGQIRATG